MKKRKLVFEDTPSGTEMFFWVFYSHSQSPIRYKEADRIRRGSVILDARDAISEESDPGRRAKKEGVQEIVLTAAEYEQFKEAVYAFEWPVVNTREATDVREFIDGAESFEDGDQG